MEQALRVDMVQAVEVGRVVVALVLVQAAILAWEVVPPVLHRPTETPEWAVVAVAALMVAPLPEVETVEALVFWAKAQTERAALMRVEAEQRVVVVPVNLMAVAVVAL